MSLLKFKRTAPGALAPLRGTKESAGLDLHVLEDSFIPNGCTMKLRTGIALEIEPGLAGVIMPRSSAFKRGLIIHGLVDADYRGEVHIIVNNCSGESVKYRAGEAMAQLLIQPVAMVEVEEVQQLSESGRGEQGFGSTGRVGVEKVIVSGEPK